MLRIPRSVASRILLRPALSSLACTRPAQYSSAANCWSNNCSWNSSRSAQPFTDNVKGERPVTNSRVFFNARW